MKKIILLLLLSSSLFSVYSCQDEFCSDTTTPQLIVRFYDKDALTKKKSIQLIVKANDKDNLFNGQAITTDSLVLPLDTKSNTVTYHFSNQEDPENVLTENLIIEYNVNDVYVSKSCGFKSIFENVSVTTTNNSWLENKELTTTSIFNENNAHVKIFH